MFLPVLAVLLARTTSLLKVRTPLMKVAFADSIIPPPVPLVQLRRVSVLQRVQYLWLASRSGRQC